MSYNAKVKLTSTEGAIVYADTLPIPTADRNGRDGWLFTKTTGVEKFNYYIWSQGSRAMRLKDLKSVYMVGSVDTYTDIKSIPFIVVYTKPTGSGDAASWYHSKIAHVIADTETINLGEIVYFHTHSILSPSGTYRHVALNVEIKTGEALPDEEILYITIHSDSGAANNTAILISQCGYRTNHKVDPQYLDLQLNSS